MLNRLKEETESHALSIRKLCPTRWTVRPNSLASIIANYPDIRTLWEEALLATTDSEIKARIRGIASQMQTYQFLFALILSEMILRHTDMLSKTLQNSQLSFTEGHEVAMLTARTLRSIWSDSKFDLFWQTAELKRAMFQNVEPQLPRKRKMPKRFEQGGCELAFPSGPKKFYRIYTLKHWTIERRLDQPGFKVLAFVSMFSVHALCPCPVSICPCPGFIRCPSGGGVHLRIS